MPVAAEYRTFDFLSSRRIRAQPQVPDTSSEVRDKFVGVSWSLPSDSPRILHIGHSVGNSAAR